MFLTFLKLLATTKTNIYDDDELQLNLDHDWIDDENSNDNHNDD